MLTVRRTGRARPLAGLVVRSMRRNTAVRLIRTSLWPERTCCPGRAIQSDEDDGPPGSETDNRANDSSGRETYAARVRGLVDRRDHRLHHLGRDRLLAGARRW